MSSSLNVEQLTSRPSAGKSHFAILLFLSMALMAALLNSSAPTPLYPLYQQHLGLKTISLTIIYGAYAGGVLISLLGIGNVAGRITDLRRVILPALLIVFCGALLFSLADTFWLLFFARLLAGVGTGALTGAANIALLRFGPQDSGKIAALIATVSFTTGLALGPIFSGIALQTGFHPTTLPFMIIMGLVAIAMAGVSLNWPLSEKVSLTPLSSEPLHGGDTSLKSGLKATGAKFVLCALALFTCWGVAASMLSLGPNVAERLLGLHNRGVFGYVIAAYLSIAGISQILSRGINARHSLIVGCLMQALSVIIFSAAIAWHSLALAAVGIVIGGYAYGAIFVGSATLLNRISPKASHARLISLFYVIAYVGNWVPILLGKVIDSGGLLLASHLLFTLSTLTCLILAFSVTKTDF
jgi:MFS family permease